MVATYVVAGAGLAVGFATVFADPPSLTWAVLLTVGGGGLLSFVRHSLVSRADAARMKGAFAASGDGINAFQVEVGLANLAWALVAIGAVIWGWGLAVEAGTFLVFGLYMLGAAVAQLVLHRGWLVALGSASFGGLMTVIGIVGMTAAS